MPAPTVFTKKVLERLRTAFAYGATDEEACAFAKIATSSLYNYQKYHAEFLEEKNRFKQNPILRARKTVVDNLEDVKNAQWYLERKKKDEFSLRQELTGKDGEGLKINQEVDPKILKTVLETANAYHNSIDQEEEETS